MDLDKIIANWPADRFVLYRDSRPPQFGDYKQLEVLGGDPRKFHVVGPNDNRNFVEFSKHLETNFFAFKNNDLEIRIIKWHEGRMYSILTIPLEKRELCYESADAVGIVLKPGLPIAISTQEIFPLQHAENCVTVQE